MEISLPYGRSQLAVKFPARANVTVIRKRAAPLISDPRSAVEGALAKGALSGSFNAEAASAKNACILVCDITRPVPNGLILNPLVNLLERMGIPRSNILILVATGLHRPNLGQELQDLIDDEVIYETVQIENHKARNTNEHVDLGVTRSGTPVALDRRFVEADLKIATGLVEPHFMAGYSGGRKVIVPGIAHANTIGTLHSARFLEDPSCVSCNTSNNPLHLEQIEILQMLRDYSRSEIYAVNTVIDENRNLSFVNFGEIESSHQEAMDFAHRYCSVAINRKFQTIVSTAAGYPLDLTYYQAVKGMVAPLDILEKDGTLVLAAECSEGLGSDAYRDAQRKMLAEGPDQFLRRLEAKTIADTDEWETEMQLKAQRNFHISLFADALSHTDKELTGVNIVDSVEEGIELGLSRSTGNDIAVIPEGPYVVPQYV